MLTDTYARPIHRQWYRSIAIEYVLLRVRFEVGLSISVLRKGQLFTKIELKPDRFLKHHKFFTVAMDAGGARHTEALAA